jgi:hypothetical protein
MPCSSTLRKFEAFEDLRHFGLGWVVDYAALDFGAEYVVNHVIETRFGNGAVDDGLLEGFAEVVGAGHLLIEAGHGSLLGAVGSAPVGEDPAFEAPGVLEHVGQQVFVFAGPVAVDLVVGAHDGARFGDVEANLEGEEVGLAEGTLVEYCVDDIASGFLIVDGVVLDVSDHVGGLHALHQFADEGSGEDWIFAQILKVAAVPWLTSDVDAAAERHVEALFAKLAATFELLLQHGAVMKADAEEILAMAVITKCSKCVDLVAAKITAKDIYTGAFAGECLRRRHQGDADDARSRR